MTHHLKEGEKVAVRLLEAAAHTVRETGYPEQPLIMQTDPREEFQIFVCLWRQFGPDRGLTVFPVSTEMRKK